MVMTNILLLSSGLTVTVEEENSSETVVTTYKTWGTKNLLHTHLRPEHQRT
jgi:hypothetical protein